MDFRGGAILYLGIGMDGVWPFRLAIEFARKSVRQEKQCELILSSTHENSVP